jgi:8-oxo-dGTP diphosphatase
MPVPTTPGEILAGNIAAARGRRRLQQSDLADRMRALGWKWVRQTVGEIENNRRRVSTDELIGLSYALETEVGNLLLPAPGEVRLAALPAGQLVILPLQHEMPDGMGGSVLWDGNRPKFSAPQTTAAQRAAVTRLPPPAPQTVIAGVVTSDRGVLVTRRVDQNPPWGFTAGWGEPGESPEDTIIREVKEEADLRIEVGEYLGERDHPATGKHMIYYAARPTHGTEIHLGDRGELLEVRWVNLAEADELLPGMFGPVREYLARELGEG